MFWMVLLVIGVATTFGALGAYSVWFKIFAGVFKFALLIAGVLTLAFVWKRVFQSSRAKESESQ